jgi:hypothetical protein
MFCETKGPVATFLNRHFVPTLTYIIYNNGSSICRVYSTLFYCLIFLYLVTAHVSVPVTE